MIRRLTLHEAKVCFKLFRKGCFGKGHMLEENVSRGFPSHEIGEVKESIASLRRDGILVRKASAHGPAVYIAPKLRFEVADRIREHPEYGWLR